MNCIQKTCGQLAGAVANECRFENLKNTAHSAFLLTYFALVVLPTNCDPLNQFDLNNKEVTV
ncbi:hypothetical protein K0U07_00170 [bacterium]|nr:hypothetical protein [bacterium]